VWRQDEDGDAVSMPRPSWPQAVPLARGSEPRGAKGYQKWKLHGREVGARSH